MFIFLVEWVDFAYLLQASLYVLRSAFPQKQRQEIPQDVATTITDHLLNVLTLQNLVLFKDVLAFYSSAKVFIFIHLDFYIGRLY